MLVGLWLGTALAAVQPPLTATPRATPISGGAPVATCGWPSVVATQTCSAILIDAEHVITAAHCGDLFEVFFGEDRNLGDGRYVRTTWCEQLPGDGEQGGGDDFSVCRLAEPQLDVPIVPPLMGCELDALQPGTEVTVVGFGRTEDGTRGVKHAVTTTLVERVEDELFIGGGGEDSCVGDSGGPAFVRLPSSYGEDEWRVAGITSHGDEDCIDGGYYSIVPIGMPWFEEMAGFDLTPCHDADGAWSPDARCGGFPRDPAAATGSWTSACESDARTDLASTCGAPFDAPPDTTPLQLAIASPSDGTRLDSDPDTGSAALALVVEAVDEGWGLDRVEVLVDGKRAPRGGVLRVPPLEASLTLTVGAHEVALRGFDLAGNVTETDPIAIGVDVDVAPLGTGGTGEDAGETDTDDQGCGCRASDSGSGLLAWGPWVLLAVRRRTRQT